MRPPGENIVSSFCEESRGSNWRTRTPTVDTKGDKDPRKGKKEDEIWVVVKIMVPFWVP